MNAASALAVQHLEVRADGTTAALAELVGRTSAFDTGLARISDELGNDRQFTLATLREMSNAQQALGAGLIERSDLLIATNRLHRSQGEGWQTVIEGLVSDLSKTLIATSGQVDALHERLDATQSRRWCTSAWQLLGSSREK